MESTYSRVESIIWGLIERGKRTICEANAGIQEEIGNGRWGWEGERESSWEKETCIITS